MDLIDLQAEHLPGARGHQLRARVGAEDRVRPEHGEVDGEDDRQRPLRERDAPERGQAQPVAALVLGELGDRQRRGVGGGHGRCFPHGFGGQGRPGGAPVPSIVATAGPVA